MLQQAAEAVIARFVTGRLPARTAVLARAETGARVAVDVVSGPAEIPKDEIAAGPESRQLGLQVADAALAIDERPSQKRDAQAFVGGDDFDAVRFRDRALFRAGPDL